MSACHFADELSGALARPGGASALPPDEAPRDVHDDTAELLVVEGLSKSFAVGGGPFRKSGSVHAVDDISFSLRKGEVLGLVGESGSGKSTTARVLLGLEQATGGSLRFDGDDITDPRARTVLQRRRIQVVFQNPDASLDPRMTIAEIVAEPLVVHGIGDATARRARAAELMERVGLSPDVLTRYPHEFSGGQRQRIAIARALAPSPDLVVCDEPVTALDVSVQAQILNLLQDVQRDEGLAYLFIAHDLSVVRQLADRVAVMYLGEIVELAPADGFFAGPRHPYSKALLSAMPAPDPLAERRRERITISGTVPSPLDPPPGCRFHTRCWKAQAVCRESVPPLREHGGGGVAACHFPEAAADVTAASRMPLPAAVAAAPEEDHHRV